MANKHSVADHGDLRKYFTAIPNIVFTLGLNAYELALYVYLKRVAGEDEKCWKSTATIAKEANMSAGMVSKTKTSLSLPLFQLGNKSLITIVTETRNGGNPNHVITITDIWPENMAELSRVREVKATRSRHEGARSPREGDAFTTRTKEEPVKKNPKEMSGYALLFDKHYRRIGDVPNAKAQGEAIKWILARHAPEKAIACYDAQLKEPWRNGHVDWLTVKSRIGEFHSNGNGRNYVDEDWDKALTMKDLEARMRA